MADTKNPVWGGVSLTLAGVLAVGMVPAVALADDAADVITDDAIELLTNATIDEQFENALTVSAVGMALDPTTATNLPTKAELAKKLTITDGEIHVPATDAGSLYVVPTEIKLADGTIIDPFAKDGSNREYTVSFHDAKTGGNTVADPKAATVADYWVRITATANNQAHITTNKVFAVHVVVDKTDISTATLWNSADSNKDVTKTAFTYSMADGHAQSIGIALDGQDITTAINGNYTVAIYDTDTRAPITGVSVLADIKAAGKYTVVLTGTNRFKGTATVNIVVDKYVLSADNVAFTKDIAAPADAPTADGKASGSKAAVKLGGTTYAATTSELAVSVKSDPSGYVTAAAQPGVWTYTVAPKDDDAKKNIDGSVDLTFTEVTTVTANDIRYDSANVADILTDLSAASPTLYDKSKITTTSGSLFDVTYTTTDDEGNEVAAAEADLTTKPGVYTVTVEETFDATKNNYAVYDKQSFKVTVAKKNLASATPLVTFKGNTIAESAAQAVTYNGSDWLDQLAVTITNGDGTLAYGTDFTYYIEKDSAEVKSGKIVDADGTNNYEVYVDAPDYNIFGSAKTLKVATIKVSPLTLKDTGWKFTTDGDDTIRVAEEIDADDDGTYDTIAYEGEDIVPTFQYFVKVDDKGTAATTDDERVFETLDASLYKLTLTNSDGEEVAAITGAGAYTYKLEATDADGAANFDWTSVASGTIKVTAQKYKLNYDASKLLDSAGDSMGTVTGLTNGAANTALGTKVTFEAKANDGYELVGVEVTGADGAAVEYTTEEKDDGSTEYTFTMPNQDVTVNVNFQIAGFKDTADSVFADVINKAATAGLVHGYADGSFRPNKTITRAEVATILYNAAVGATGDETEPVTPFASGTYETGFDDVANTFWAAPYIGWARAAGVVNGNGGKFRPNDPVTREEFAAMLANYVENVDNTALADGELPISRVKDYDSVASWAKAVVKWAVTNGVMGNGGAVQPKAKATRGEVTAMLVNYLDTTGYFD